MTRTRPLLVTLRVALVSGLSLSSVLVGGQARAQGPSDRVTVLTNASVIDATGAPLRSNVSVVIDGNRIVGIDAGPYRPSPATAAARVIDLEGAYVLPGLWNNHSHPSDLLPDPKNILSYEALLPAAIRAGRNTMDALRRGFTGLRVTGERHFIDVAWRDAFEAGVFVGPRIIPSGNPIAATGGHGWRIERPLSVQVDGPYEMRKQVREMVKNGAQYIKLMVGELQPDEIAAAIETAHQEGVPVTADASEPYAGIAVKLGIDSIEHGDALTDETLRLMAEQGTYYDPTIVCNLSAEYIAERERRIAELGLDEPANVLEGRVLVAYADERSPETARAQRDVLRRAMAAGVKIVSGGDSNPLGEIGLLEIEMLVFSGMSEMDALIAATRTSAEMNGLLDDLGTVEVGKIADLIVLAGNPLEHISNIRKLSMVFKDGLPVNLARDEGQASFWDLYFLDTDGEPRR